MLDLLARIPEPRRRDTRTVDPLINVLFITVAGTLAGMRGWKALVNFAEAHAAWVGGFFDLSAGIPPRQTLKRVIGGLAPDALEEFLRDRGATLGTRLRREVVFRRFALILLTRDTTYQAGTALRMQRAATMPSHLEHGLSLADAGNQTLPPWRGGDRPRSVPRGNADGFQRN